jgi:hypothetical protein
MRKKKNELKLVGIRIPLETYLTMQAYGAIHDLTVSQIARLALKRWLEKEAQ